MDNNQPVIDTLNRFISDPNMRKNAIKISRKWATLTDPMKALSSKSFTKKNIFFTSITWNEDLNLEQKLAIIASANFDEPLLEKLDTLFVFIDEDKTTKLAHQENFHSPVRPHDSIVDLFFHSGGKYFLNDNVSSKHIGESIFKYLVYPNGKVSTEKIGINSNSSVTTDSSVTTSSTEAFPALGGKKSNADPMIWGKQKQEEQKPCLLKRVKALYLTRAQKT